jgi:hypothetical protein
VSGSDPARQAQQQAACCNRFRQNDEACCSAQFSPDMKITEKQLGSWTVETIDEIEMFKCEGV